MSRRKEKKGNVNIWILGFLIFFNKGEKWEYCTLWECRKKKGDVQEVAAPKKKTLRKLKRKCLVEHDKPNYVHNC